MQLLKLGWFTTSVHYLKKIKLILKHNTFSNYSKLNTTGSIAFAAYSINTPP